MRKLFFFVFSILTTSFLMAQPEVLSNAPYQAAWRQIDSLLSQQLPESAKEAVLALQARAEAANEQSHVLKTKLYAASLHAQLEEAGTWSALQQLSLELARTEGAEQAVLASLLAEAYQQYAQNNRWQLNNRTRTTEAPTEEESTWTLADFYQKATELYLASLSELDTRQLQWADFSPLVIPGTNSKVLRPTLYDILLHRALEYFRNSDAFYGQAAYQTTLNDLELLGSRSEFIAYEWDKETASLGRLERLLQVFQEALLWRQSQQDAPEALLDLDLTRLRYIHQYLTHTDKDEAYQQALSQLVDENEGYTRQAMPRLELARWYMNQSQTYFNDQLLHSDERWRLATAMRLLTQLQKDFPDSYEASLATSMIGQITRPRLSVQLESVILPDAAGLLSIEYRNLPQLNFRLVKLSEEDYLFGQHQEKWLETVVARPSLRIWSEKLPDAGDYLVHRTESSFPGLNGGVYALLVSAKADFPANMEYTATASFWVSELGVIHQQNYRTNSELMVVNRSSGKPVANASVELWRQAGRQQRRKQIISTYTTNADGQVKIDKSERGSLYIGVSTADDRLYTLDGTYLQTSIQPPQSPNPQLNFFLDRAIYRPGQTLYFKGLLTQAETVLSYPDIKEGQKVSVSLHDANGQKVDEQTFTTNSWGTISGHFSLPQGGLLGNMSLRTEYSSISFRVEAYKRPRFKVELDDLAQAAQLGDTLSISGNALTYAGPPVADAELIYTVTRRMYYPWFYWRYMPGPEETSIATGTVQTDEAGNFTFDFPALAVHKASGSPHYHFQIKVDVTDAAGETRSAEKSLYLADFPVLLSLHAPEQQDRKEELEVALKSVNYDDQDVECVVDLNIYPLPIPNRVQVERYWPLPDTMIIEEPVFKRRFPYLAYKTFGEQTVTPTADPVWKQSLTLNGSDSLSITVADWPVGKYLIELSTISPKGDTLRQRQELSINDWSTEEFSTDKPLYVWSPRQSYQPGETLSIRLGTAAQDVGVYTERLVQLGDLHRQWYQPKQTEIISFPLSESERGHLTYRLQYFYQNRHQQKDLSYEIPWSNKRLDIQLETFRAKLRPGQPETWRLRVTAPEEEGAKAELLASMYDASLDQFVAHAWHFSPEPSMRFPSYWRASSFESIQLNPWLSEYYTPIDNGASRAYPKLLTIPLSGLGRSEPIMYMAAGAPRMAKARNEAFAAPMADGIVESEANITTEESIEAPGSESSTPPPLRTNLQETAFFQPQLHTLPDGSIALEFTSPEALTSWKLQLFAHDKELAYDLRTEEVVTQKELMILPNFPRFLRTGDKIRLAANVSSLADRPLQATATLELFDLATEQALDDWVIGSANDQVELAAQGTTTATWELAVPANFSGALGYRVYVRAENFSDGEEGFWPILSNQVLVTESQPIFVSGGKEETFTLERLAQSATDRRQHQLRFDMLANPVWEAIKALPYLQEYPYDCTEQLMNRWFANSLALHIASTEPKLETYYESWAKDSTALLSPLAQNDGNKTALLTETPWVRDALAESEQRRQLRKLFDREARQAEQATDWRKILERQNNDGSFSWFPGGPSNTYMTQYILEQYTRLNELIDLPARDGSFVASAIQYLDEEMGRRYRMLEGRKQLAGDHFDPTVAQYLYVRSAYPDIQLPNNDVFTYWLQQAADHWTQQPLQTQAYVAIALKRHGRTDIVAGIFQSLRERSRYREQLGRYWPAQGGWYWYEHPLETHCLLMEAYRELGGTTEEQDQLRLWLLRNKETNRWETTKATAAAIHALLNDGTSWQADQKPLAIRFPQSQAATRAVAQAQVSAEAGTGYFQLEWEAPEVKPELARVEVRNPNTVPAWGGLYWQYFSPIEDIEVADNTPLQIERKLFTRVATTQGEELRPVQGPVSIGDAVTVRLVIRTDRDMEFVHLKDLRAAGLEPTQVLSGYRYQGGLGYYQSTTDLATHFFFDILPQGEYVLEYDLRVFHAGDFSGGMASLQCMYAPKFTGHSEGERISGKVK